MEFIQNFDKTVLQFIAIDMKNGLFDFFMPIISSLGNFGIIWIILCIAFLFGKHTRKYAIVLGIALIISSLLGDFIIKPLVGRLRPYELNKSYTLLIGQQFGHSFPSGHALIAFASAYILEKINSSLGTIAYILAFLMAFSRIYLYVHFPTDVLAGMIIGTLISAFICFLFRNSVFPKKAIKH